MNPIKAVSLVLLAIACVEKSEPAQDAFAALSVPPDSMGSCVASPAIPDTGSTAHHLVIKSIPPGSSREIQVLANRTTTVYHELASKSGSGPTANAQSVFATLDATGAVLVGRVTDLTTASHDSAGIPKDLAGFEKWREQLSIQQSSREFNAEEQAKVVRVIDYLRQRCPA